MSYGNPNINNKTLNYNQTQSHQNQMNQYQNQRNPGPFQHNHYDPFNPVNNYDDDDIISGAPLLEDDEPLLNGGGPPPGRYRSQQGGGNDAFDTRYNQIVGNINSGQQQQSLRDAQQFGNKSGVTGNSSNNQSSSSSEVTTPNLRKSKLIHLTFTIIISLWIIYGHLVFEGAKNRNTLYVMIILTLAFTYPIDEKAYELEHKAKLPLVDGQNQTPIVNQKKGPTVRLLFLDRLKNMLTFFLITYHINIGMGSWGWMPYTLSIGNNSTLNNNVHLKFHPNSSLTNTGKVHDYHLFQRILSCFNLINQGYFMCLFFFISGYFIPASLGRKGQFLFLRDKFKRLGLPLVFGSLVGFPLTTYFSQQFAFHDLPYFTPFQTWYIVAPGPLWYLQTLLILSIISCVIMPKGLESSIFKFGAPVYVMKDFPSAQQGNTNQKPDSSSQTLKYILPLPTFFSCITLGTFLGIIQWYLFNKFNRFSLFDIPSTTGGGGMVFDIMFFYAGCLAKKHGWLEEMVEMGQQNEKINRNSMGGIDSNGGSGNQINLNDFFSSPQKMKERTRLVNYNREVKSFRQHVMFMIFSYIMFCLLSSKSGLAVGPMHTKCKPWREEYSKRYGSKHPEILEALGIKSGGSNSGSSGSGSSRHDSEEGGGFNQGSKSEYDIFDFNSLVWNIMRGQFTITMIFYMLTFFAEKMNYQEEKVTGANGTTVESTSAIWNTYVSNNAYGAYVFHWMVWPIVLGILMKLTYNPEFEICKDRTYASSAKAEFGQIGLMGTWWLTVVGTNVILWPLADFVKRKVPGADGVF